METKSKLYSLAKICKNWILWIWWILAHIPEHEHFIIDSLFLLRDRELCSLPIFGETLIIQPVAAQFAVMSFFTFRIFLFLFGLFTLFTVFTVFLTMLLLATVTTFLRLQGSSMYLMILKGGMSDLMKSLWIYIGLNLGISIGTFSNKDIITSRNSYIWILGGLSNLRLLLFLKPCIKLWISKHCFHDSPVPWCHLIVTSYCLQFLLLMGSIDHCLKYSS